MELKTAACCCLCDDFLISEGRQSTMSTAEVITAALAAAAFFSGSHEKSCKFLEEHGYTPDMISKSQFSRRLSGIPESVWLGLTKQACHAVSRNEFIKNLSLGQLSCLPEHPHTALQNISGRMLPGTCLKPEGILLRAESSCADDRIMNSCGNISVSNVIFRHKFSL